MSKANSGFKLAYTAITSKSEFSMQGAGHNLRNLTHSKPFANFENPELALKKEQELMMRKIFMQFLSNSMALASDAVFALEKKNIKRAYSTFA